MQNRQRYHIIIDTLENVPVVREQLEQSSLVDIKTWKSFPLLINLSLTEAQALWIKSHPYVVSVDRTQSIYLHEANPRYEIQTNEPGLVRAALLNLMDVVVETFADYPKSVFVRLDQPGYLGLMTAISNGTISDVTNVVVNENPIREYSRVLNLQRYNWGIERIAHRSTRFYETVSLTKNGAGTRIYIIDTGIQSNHDELIGRVSADRFDAFRDPSDPHYGEPSLESEIVDGKLMTDDHGTHVASIAAGTTVGVAPAATLVSVRAFSRFEESTTEQLLDAVDWVIQHHSANPMPSIVNLSLAVDDSAIGGSRLGDILVRTLVEAGLPTIVSAGNQATDAIVTSPANAGSYRALVENSDGYMLETFFEPWKPITVGASVYPQGTTDTNDAIWSGSNWGDVVDLFAPGAEIYAASLQVDSQGVLLDRTGSYDLKSGTSMAAPMVAGIAALHLQANPSLTHSELRKILIETSTANVFNAPTVIHKRVDAPRYADSGMSVTVDGLTNPTVRSPNRLAYAGFTNTRIEWPEQSYAITADERTRALYELTASSTDYYGDFERVDFKFAALDIPAEYDNFDFITFYNTLEYVGNLGNITVQADIANFRINTPVVTSDISGRFMILADDGRTTSARRFVINTLNVPEAPVWQSPFSGDLMPEPVHKGDRFDFDTLQFVATQSDGLPITYSVTPANAFPPGVQFVNDLANSRAYLRGIVSSIPYSSKPVVYEFLIRATAANGLIAERLFRLTCEYKNELHFFTPSWISALYDYSQDYPGVKYFGSASAGNSYYKHVEVVNKDADPLVYELDFVPSVLDAPGIFNGSLPTGLSISSTGDIQGIVDPSSLLGLYFFRIKVTDLDDNQIHQDFVLRLDTSEDVLQESDQIIWITPAGSIGQIWETFPSHLYVEARNPEGTPVRYSLSPAGGVLPDGMEVNPNTGLITGLAPFVTNSIVYQFTVRATVGSRFIDREFSLSILSQYEGASTLNFKANLFGPDRLDIQRWVKASEIIPDDQIFRSSDPFFGIPQTPHMYVLSGATVVAPTAVLEYLRDYHKRMHLLFGSLKWAPAYDPSGFHAYDVIYMSVVDPMSKAGGFAADGTEDVLRERQANPFDVTEWNEQTKLSRYYPNSIGNARSDLSSTRDERLGLGLVGQEGLPLWMRSRRDQSRPEIVGFTPGIIVAYVKAGTGQKHANALVLKGYDKAFVGREFVLDRYYISDIITKVTTRFDVQNDEPLTVFDDPTVPNVQGDDLSHLVQQTLFDVKTIETGKYYKFEDDAPILEDRLQNPYR